jgi:hypothetical protein
VEVLIQAVAGSWVIYPCIPQRATAPEIEFLCRHCILHEGNGTHQRRFWFQFPYEEPYSPWVVAGQRREMRLLMNQIIYLIGLVVVIMAVLSLLGLR